jgi:hypothetical protein
LVIEVVVEGLITTSQLMAVRHFVMQMAVVTAVQPVLSLSQLKLLMGSVVVVVVVQLTMAVLGQVDQVQLLLVELVEVELLPINSTLQVVVVEAMELMDMVV